MHIPPCWRSIKRQLRHAAAAPAGFPLRCMRMPHSSLWAVSWKWCCYSMYVPVQHCSTALLPTSINPGSGVRVGMFGASQQGGAAAHPSAVGILGLCCLLPLATTTLARLGTSPCLMLLGWFLFFFGKSSGYLWWYGAWAKREVQVVCTYQYVQESLRLELGG